MDDTSHTHPLRILLIEDDEDDYILTRSLFSEIRGRRFELSWVTNYKEGLEQVLSGHHDISLVDYRLGARDGIELLEEAEANGNLVPIILLTGQGEHEIDVKAMRAGAADYLVKGRLDSALLERSIRYALERKRAAAKAASEQARLAAFGADVGLALTRRDSLEAILQGCATAMVRYLNAGLARLWIYEKEEQVLRLQASAGNVRDLGPLPLQKAKALIDLDQIRRGRPILIHPVQGDLRVPDQGWARQEGLVSFAAYPLLLEERLVGMMSMFARHSLDTAILQEMSSVANGVALCIDRKRSAEALDASEVKYRTVVENIKEVIFQTNETGEWIFLNPAWSEITGHPVQESIGRSFNDFIHPEDQQRHGELLQEVIELKVSFCRDEARYRARDGSYRWVEVYAQPTFDGEGAVLGASGTISDITERRRAEQEIQKLAAFPKFNPDPVLEFNAGGRLTYLNQAAQEMSQALGVDAPEAMLPEAADAIARQCLQTGRSKVNLETSLNGRTLTWSFLPILASNVVHCYGSDITDRIHLETQLRHSQKMESVGQLAAGVAHDFNNILTIIQGHSDLLIQRCPAEASVQESVEQIDDAAKRAATLTRQLLTFSRKQVMQPKTTDLNQIIGNMTKMLGRLLREDVLLESNTGRDLTCIEADPGMLEQIIMNLAVNARDAMPKGGRLLIETYNIQLREEDASHHADARPGDFVCLSVSDTGCGMDQETVNRIFEPFFTTKEVGKGTGLGLATVYGIVKQHQGWIDVQSEPGLGTTFKVYFPASDKTAKSSDTQHFAASHFLGRQETILLVEDEPVLRELARTILQSYNYRVLEASHGKEALDLFERDPEAIDLLLTDMVMPEGMNGRELAEKFRARKPQISVIYTSGYSADVMEPDLESTGALFLQKPYPPPQLAQTVRACLDQPKRAA